MRKQKEHIHQHQAHPDQFKNLQAKAIPHKMEEIKKMLAKNHDLTKINNSLYRCIAIIARQIRKSRADNSEISKALKQIMIIGNSNEARTTELCTRIQQSTHQGQSLLPSIAKLKRHNSSTASATTTQSSSKEDSSFEEQTFKMMPQKQAHLLINQLKQLITNQNDEIQQLKLSLSSQKLQYNKKIYNLEVQIRENNKKIGRLQNKIKKIKSIKVITVYDYQKFKKSIVQFITASKFKIDKQLSQFLSNLQLKLQDKNKELIIIAQKNFYNELKINIQKIVNIKIDNDENKITNLAMQIKQKFRTNIDNAQQEILMKILKKIQQLETDKNRQQNEFQQISQTNIQAFLAITKKCKQVYDENIKLQSMLEVKPKVNKQSIQQIWLNNPMLSFFNSRTLPIFGTENAQKIYDKQMFILQAVENYYKKNKKIFMFKLLYGFQHFRETKINFHFLVDNLPNLLLIVLLKNGTIIGAFSQTGLCQTPVPNKNRGFLFQADNKRIFSSRLKYQTNAIFPFEDFYISVGNQDINIKMESTLVQSCFGSETSMFRPNSQYKINDFLNSGEEVSQAQLLDYEFYQVQFHPSE